MDGRQQDQRAIRATWAAVRMCPWVCRWVLSLATLVGCPAFLHGQAPEIVEGKRDVADARIISVETRQFGIVMDGIRVVVEQVTTQTEVDDERLPVAGQAAGRHVLTIQHFRIPDAGLQGFVFGSAGNAAAARSQLDTLLRRKITAATAACRLAEVDQQKLNLAGRGDIKRLFDRFEIQRAMSQEPHPAEQGDGRGGIKPAVELIRAAQPLRQAFESGPFEDGSLFAKTLAKIARPGRVAANPLQVQVLAPRLEPPDLRGDRKVGRSQSPDP